MISKLHTGIWHPKYQGGNNHLKQYLNANIWLKLSTLVDENESFLFLGCISRYSQANKQNRLHGRQILKKNHLQERISERPLLFGWAICNLCVCSSWQKSFDFKLPQFEKKTHVLGKGKNECSIFYVSIYSLWSLLKLFRLVISQNPLGDKQKWGKKISSF